MQLKAIESEADEAAEKIYIERLKRRPKARLKAAEGEVGGP